MRQHCRVNIVANVGELGEQAIQKMNQCTVGTPVINNDIGVNLVHEENLVQQALLHSRIVLGVVLYAFRVSHNNSYVRTTYIRFAFCFTKLSTGHITWYGTLGYLGSASGVCL